MGASIFSRKMDLVYLVHFAMSVPLMFLMDLQAIYPPAFVPEFMKSLKNYYITTYNDRFFVEPQPFFQLFITSELVYQIPVMIWAIGGLYRNSPKVPLVLLPYSVWYFLTSITCMYEYTFWDTPYAEKIELSKLYGPYALLSLVMGLDMYFRLNKVINQATAGAVRDRKKRA